MLGSVGMDKDVTEVEEGAEDASAATVREAAVPL